MHIILSVIMDLSPLAETPYPEASLVVGGLIALSLGIYGKRDDSVLDEIGTIAAFAVGIAMLVVFAAVMIEDALGPLSLAAMFLLSVCLFMRPLRGVSWSTLAGVAIASVVTYAASMIMPSEVLGVEEWKILVALFLVVGMFVYLSTRVFEWLVKLSTSVLSWRSSVSLIGAIALAEGLYLAVEGESLLSFF